ncbi:hypothetical protein [Agromyces salentinus]|uniref:Uncharacterized protein n=1 Tax=Agromyces salentinus TaxID=269421 RepID=A0ABP4Z1T0_9MICO|nr:hypothetical protein [Agromyces salentinus]
MSEHENENVVTESTTGTQDAPIQDGSTTDADDGDRLEGVIEQIRADMLTGRADDVQRMARERLEQAGLSATQNDVDAVVSAVQSAS